MKKKSLLIIAMLAILTCIFAITVSAAETDTSIETVTLSDGTKCPLWDADGNGLIWYISSSENNVNTYACVSATDSSVDYYNGWSGGNQLNSITITAADGSKYDKTAIVVANIRDAKITSGHRIGNGITYFNSTFFEAKKLEYVYVPVATTGFGTQDFKSCSSLKYVNLEELTELTSIGSQSFNGCSKLFEGKKLDLSNTKISQIGAGGLATVAASEIILPDTLVEVQNYAFRSCKATRIVFNSTLTKINTSELFSSCNFLESIEGFGPTVESGLFSSIGHNMFKDNYKLKNIDGLMENGILIIPEGFTSINTNCAFTNCDQIVYVEFPSTINYIGQAAFSYCDNLKLVSFDKVNAKIANAIANGQSYTKVTFNNCGIFKGCKSLVAMSVPEGTTEIVNRFVAEGCTSLTAVYLPNSVTSMGTNGGSQGPFCNANNMYFVNESFTVGQCLVDGKVDLTKLDLPEKPTVYYMPTSLTSFTGHVESNQYSKSGTIFLNCYSINDVIVFGESFQNFNANSAFQNLGSTSSPKTIVFTGDITGYVTTQNAKNVNFVFANENDKTPADIGITHVYKNNNNANSFMYFAVKDEATDTVTTYKYAYSTEKNEITDTTAIGTYITAVEEKKVEEHVIDYKNSVITKSPTCTEAGLLIAVCLCGEGMGNIELDALGHTYIKLVTAPTCLTDGYTTYYCSTCGDTYVGDNVSALGHKDGETAIENSVAPDCVNDGSYDEVVYCTVCNQELSRNKVTVDALGHKYVSSVTKPDCTNDGYTTHTCSVCNDTYVDARVDALGHSYKETVVAPTCTSKGSTTYVCENCNDTYSEEIAIDANAHAFDGANDVDCNNGCGLVRGAARIEDAYYATLEAAIANVKAGETVTLLANVEASNIITINKSVTLDGNGKTITSTAGRAINVSGATNVTIKNVTIVANGERAINIIQNSTNVSIDNVTASAKNYALCVTSSAKGAVVTVNGSTLNGLNVINVGAENADITVNITTINCNDNSANENYSAIALNKDAVNAKVIAIDTTVNVHGDSNVASVGSFGGYVSINGSTENVVYPAAYILGGDYYYTYETFEGAIANAKAGDTIVLLAPVTVTESVEYTIPAGVTILSKEDVFVVTNGATLTLNGNGIVKAGTAGVGSWCAVWADGGHAIINGGTYYVGGDSSTTDVTHQNDLIYTKNGGTVTINGGTFVADNGVWALNENDKNRGTITVYGGTFVGFNPANNVSEGEGTNFLADGYAAVANGDNTEFTVVEANAQIGNTYYATFEDAFEAAKAGDTIVLLAPVTITEDTELNIEGITIESAEDAFIITSGATLTLNGNGTVKAGIQGVGSWCAVWADGGHAIINGGTYYVGGDSSTTDVTHQNDLIYTKNGGTVTINGGTFVADNGVWALNENDKNRGTITVYGGTFVGFNPANNVSEGEGTNFLANGLHATANGNVYTVEAHSFDTVSSIAYANGYGKAGVKVLECACGKTIEESVDALFVALGYSASEVELGGITVGYTINNEAIAEYEKFTGTELVYGVFAAASETIGNNDIFDANGNTVGGVISKEASSLELEALNLKLVGFNTEELMAAEIVMGMYVNDGARVSYVQAESPVDGKYHTVSYDKLSKEEE